MEGGTSLLIQHLALRQTHGQLPQNISLTSQNRPVMTTRGALQWGLTTVSPYKISLRTITGLVFDIYYAWEGKEWQTMHWCVHFMMLIRNVPSKMIFDVASMQTKRKPALQRDKKMRKETKIYGKSSFKWMDGCLNSTELHFHSFSVCKWSCEKSYVEIHKA